MVASLQKRLSTVLQHCLVLLLMLFFLETATAADALDVLVDRPVIHENETLKLTVKGSTELELNLGTIMNRRSIDFPEPDLTELKESFDIVAQRRAYSLQSINGEHFAEVTWTYQLAPRKTGELMIPSIEFNGVKSEPRTVEVKPGSVSPMASRYREAWVNAEIDKDQVYIQEQLVLTLKLYFRGSLVGGDLTEPQLENAIVEPLGEQRQTSEFIDNRHYRVVERRYTVYPQRSGHLTIESQQFTGRQRDPATGVLRFLRAQSPELQVEVLTPPKDFPGNQWIAAESLVLDEQWSRAPENLTIGDSLTQVLTVRTLGLMESALPLLEMDYPDRFKAYPEPPRSESKFNSDTIEASRAQTVVLVAVKSGTVTLPEVKLHWWDTVNDQARIAVIPERTLTVLPAPGSGGQAGSAEVTGSADTDPPKAAKFPPPLSAAESDIPSPWWIALAVLLGLGVLAALILWRGKSQRESRDKANKTPAPAANLDALKHHALQGNVEALREIPAWVRSTFNRPDIRTLQDVRVFFQDVELNHALDRLEKHHFSQRPENHKWGEGETLAAALQRLSLTRPSRKKDRGALPPFRKLPGH